MKNISKYIIPALLSTLVVTGIAYAGNLTAPSGSPSAQSYTLGDIYTRLTTNDTATAGNHNLSTTTSPASSFYTLTQIYNAIPTIDPTKILSGTTIFGVTGNLSAGTTYGDNSAAKVLTTASTPGTYDASNLTVGKVANGITFGTSSTGTLYGDTDPSKVLTTATYPGSATAGYAYPSAPLKTDVTFCNTYSNDYDNGNYDNAVQSPCSGSGQDGETQQGVARSYTDNGNGTVSDNSTGLMWQKCGDGQSGSDCSGGGAITLAYDDGNGNLGSADLPAINYCKTLSLGGHADWRLPSINELETLVDFGQQNPAINTTYFPNTQSGSYWSSTAYRAFADFAWIVNFYDGEVNFDVLIGTHYVRCVR